MEQKFSDTGEVQSDWFLIAKKIMNIPAISRLDTMAAWCRTYNQGYGGINKVFWANGYELFRHFSIGLTTSYLFGSINNKNIILGQGSSIYLSKNNNTFFNNIYLDYGMQYYGSINSH